MLVISRWIAGFRTGKSSASFISRQAGRPRHALDTLVNKGQQIELFFWSGHPDISRFYLGFCLEMCPVFVSTVRKGRYNQWFLRLGRGPSSGGATIKHRRRVRGYPAANCLGCFSGWNRAPSRNHRTHCNVHAVRWRVKSTTKGHLKHWVGRTAGQPSILFARTGTDKGRRRRP